MFGVGPQEVVVIVLLLLVVFGPGKAVGMARDLGHFANTARDQVEEFKDEILEGGGNEDVRSDDVGQVRERDSKPPTKEEAGKPENIPPEL